MKDIKSEIQSRTANCACQNLKVTASGPPLEVHACCCFDCQLRSGSLLTYSAAYAESCVAIEGEYRSWRRSSESGRWIEYAFCPVCGVSLFCTGLAAPGFIGIAAGCFVDREFQEPAKVYWTSRRHRWFSLAEGVEAVAEQ